jgi:glycosyltransferase involved in cell wall biosynthesis
MSNDNLNFKIIVPCFNAEEWIKNNIVHTCSQTYKNWDCVILNDKSTDKTFDVISSNIPDEFRNNFILINNEENSGALYNIINGINIISDDPEDIIVLVDGDDWLVDSHVLEHLKTVYDTFNVWLTYGQYKDLRRGRQGCSQALKSTKNYRKVPWITSHLRTFKKHLWDRIKDEDMKDKNGFYYSMTWDMAIMYPMIEMAGLSRIKFVEKILYVYNNLNPLNDDKKNVELQQNLANEIKHKQPYDKIV